MLLTFALTSPASSPITLESFRALVRTSDQWTPGARRHAVQEGLKVVPVVPASSIDERYAQADALVVAPPGEASLARSGGDGLIAWYCQQYQ